VGEDGVSLMQRSLSAQPLAGHARQAVLGRTTSEVKQRPENEFHLKLCAGMTASVARTLHASTRMAPDPDRTNDVIRSCVRWPAALSVSRLLLCLLLGFVTTLALAWGCAAVMNPQRTYPQFDHRLRADGITEVRVTHRRFGHTRINRAQCAELQLDDETGDILMARWHSDGAESSETQAGWPLRALRSTNHADISIFTRNSFMGIGRSGLNPVPDGWLLAPFPAGQIGAGMWRAVPLRPMWFGLASDVFILGAMWLVAIVGVSAWRRRRRRVRGRCPWCGYDVRSSGREGALCPECGRLPSANA
jgi:hypothetical protein